MNNFSKKIKILFNDINLLKRIGFVLLALVLFRFLSTIPISGVDPVSLSKFLSGNQFFGLLNLFSGGGLSNVSIIMLGVGPYISASIIMQLLTIMVPSIKNMYQEEGEIGRQKFTMYSRLLTIPLALIQGFALLSILKTQGVVVNLSIFETIVNLVVVVAGSFFVMWIGELISEYGIGNGVSVLIFAGIVSSIPSQISQLIFTFDISYLPMYIGSVLVGLLIIFGVVFVTEAERPISVTYAKQVRGINSSSVSGSTYIPIRLNQAGVMPIIFALSILLFPSLIVNFLDGTQNAVLLKISDFFAYITENSIVYAILYFLLVFLFTYFYTAITFDPENLSSNLQRSGAFIPGVRPGNSTALHVSKILGHTTFVGAFFLGVIAVLPMIMQNITGVKTLALGGTALLIVVSVVIDLVKKINANISMHEY